MKRLPIIISLITVVTLAVMSSCNSDDNNEIYSLYEEWRDNNEAWIAEQQARTNPDGTPYFETIVPEWNPGTYVLIHYFNDRSETEGNLSPLYTSTIDTRYILHYYNDVAVDSSYNITSPAKGIFRTKLSDVIEGWAIAFETMHVGDTAEIVVPYQSAYGVSTSSSIPPYSNLRFNVRLVDIPYYEVSPE